MVAQSWNTRRAWSAATVVCVLVVLGLATSGALQGVVDLGVAAPGSDLAADPLDSADRFDAGAFSNKAHGRPGGFGRPAHAALAHPACSAQSTVDELEARWGERALRMSEAYLGSGDRVRRFVSRLVSKQPISLAVLGGSITAGHSLNATAGEITWPQMLYNWIQESYPNPKHSYVSGAVPATGIDYFATCYSLHVPTDADLYVLEGAVNDAYVDSLAASSELDVVDYTETLVRELLSSSPDTAVVMLSLWAVPHNYINGADKHSIVSEYYDVPRISERAWLYKYFMQHQNELVDHFNQQDFGHQSEKGHRYIADLLIWYLSNQICEHERRMFRPLSAKPVRGAEVLSDYAPGFVPPVTVRQRLRDAARPIPAAFCASTNAKARTGDGQWALEPIAGQGFERLEMWGKRWWTANEPGSHITFGGIEVSSGRIGLYYYRSPQPLGNMKCWVDNDEAGAKTLLGMWNYVSVGSYALIKDHVAPGLHTVTCRVLEETNDPAGESHHVRIIAVLAN